MQRTARRSALRQGGGLYFNCINYISRLPFWLNQSIKLARLLLRPVWRNSFSFLRRGTKIGRNVASSQRVVKDDERSMTPLARVRPSCSMPVDPAKRRREPLAVGRWRGDGSIGSGRA